MTPIADYIAMYGGIENVHATLSAHPTRKWNNLIQLCPTPAALDAWLTSNGIQYVEQVIDRVAGMDAICPPVPFSLAYTNTILFNSNVGEHSGQIPPQRPVDIDWLFTVLAAESARVNLTGGLHKEHSDLEYGLLPKADIDWLAANRPGRLRQWPGSDPRRDCENAVAFDKGWMIGQGLTNAAVGEVLAIVRSGSLAFAHAFSAFVDTDRKLWFLDNASADAVVKDPNALIQFGVVVTSIDIFNIKF